MTAFIITESYNIFPCNLPNVHQTDKYLKRTLLSLAKTKFKVKQDFYATSYCVKKNRYEVLHPNWGSVLHYLLQTLQVPTGTDKQYSKIQ